MARISSYSKVYAIGHKAIEGLLDGEVLVEEKVDGSQFSMCRLEDGTLLCRSRGTMQSVETPDQMFEKAIAVAKSLNLHPGWVYRGEYLRAPKHNTLAYARIPRNHIIIFDIETAPATFLSYPEKAKEAERIGLEVVPLMFEGRVESLEMLLGFLDRESVLGGTAIEGVVVKRYDLFTPDGKVAMGKYVSERFKEKHEKDWKKRNPSKRDLIEMLVETYRTEARWEKAVQHLRDRGELEGSPRDIGALIREIAVDVQEECAEEIKEILFRHFWPQVRRGIVKGAAEWYKEKLAEAVFAKGR